MPRFRRKIDLSAGLDKVMDFNDPRLSDAAFEKALVEAVYDDIVSSWTCGTDDPTAYDRAEEVADRRVGEAIKQHGLADRDTVISAVFSRAGRKIVTSPPLNLQPPKVAPPGRKD